MQLRLDDVARPSDLGDRLTPTDHITTGDQQGIVVGVGGQIAVGMADEEHSAEGRQILIGIDDKAVLGGADDAASRCRDIDTVILPPVGLGTKAADDCSATDFRRSCSSQNAVSIQSAGY